MFGMDESWIKIQRGPVTTDEASDFIVFIFEGKTIFEIVYVGYDKDWLQFASGDHYRNFSFSRRSALVSMAPSAMYFGLYTPNLRSLAMSDSEKYVSTTQLRDGKK